MSKLTVRALMWSAQRVTPKSSWICLLPVNQWMVRKVRINDVTAGGHPASPSWCRAPSWGSCPDTVFLCWSFRSSRFVLRDGWTSLAVVMCRSPCLCHSWEEKHVSFVGESSIKRGQSGLWEREKFRLVQANGSEFQEWRICRRPDVSDEPVNWQV
jgi:hypothetical protein